MSTAFKRALEKKKTSEVSLFDKEEEQVEAPTTTQAEADPEEELRAFKDADAGDKEWKNRQRTLVLCARGVNSRFRHLMNDLMDLLPHCKKENKIERKIAKDSLNDLCFQRSCNNCIFLEARKKRDFFLWLLKSPEGPSIKFSV